MVHQLNSIFFFCDQDDIIDIVSNKLNFIFQNFPRVLKYFEKIEKIQ